MYSRRCLVFAIALVTAIALGACTQVPAAVQPTSAPPTVAPTPLPPIVAPTEAPTEAPPTAVPTSVPTTVPTPEPTAVPSEVPTVAADAAPDPKKDPMGALLWASGEDRWRSATFAYTMNMKIVAADEASEKALADAAEALESLSAAGLTMTGEGALEVVDAAAGKANMRMSMNMESMGQSFGGDVIMIGNTVYARTGDSGPWQKSSSEEMDQALPGGDPTQMLEAFKNATDIEYVDVEELDGRSAHHLVVTIDPSTMNVDSLAQLAGSTVDASPEQLATIRENVTVTMDVWLAVDDLLLLQDAMTLSVVQPVPSSAELKEDASMRFAIYMTMKFDNINEPVTIEAPSE